MQRSSDAYLNRELKTTINKLQKKITELVTVDHSQFWDKKLSKIPKGGKKLWKLAKEFKGKADSNANKIKINGVQAIGDADRANCLADIFEKAHKTTASFTHVNDSIVRQSIDAFNAFSTMSCNTPIIESA